jgi:hypothetical protein
VEAGQQRIEALAARRGRVVALEEGVAIGEGRLPGYVAEDVTGLKCPGIRVEQVAVALRGILEVDGEISRPRKRREVRAQVEDVQTVTPGFISGRA